MAVPNPSRARVASTHYYEEYTEYAKTLRTWLVAYGIGGPIIYLTQKDMPREISASGYGGCIALLFLAGVLVQVAIALLYKAAAWRLHYHEELKESKVGDKDWARWVERYYVVDVIADLLTILLFAGATGWILVILR